METNLHFVVTKVDGAQILQDIKCPAESADTAMNQILAQYSQIGLLKKEEEGYYTLLPSSQIAFVECRMSSLVIATPNDTPKAAQAAGNLRKLSLV
jgi:hypothetical protein